MKNLTFRQRLLAGACCMALCYLMAGALPSGAQTFPACNGPSCHRVLVGPNFPPFPAIGSPNFVDVDSGLSSSDDPTTGNPVVTVIRAGDTVQWEFFYSHSSTSGTCAAVGSLNCTANGLWDSDVEIPGGVHRITFNEPGVFTYFCRVHFGIMRGIVVVLANAQDYDLFGNPDPTIGPPLPTPTQTIFAGGSASFAGNLNTYKGFSSTLTLTCASGNPRNPSGCPTTPTTVVPAAGAFFATQPFTFPVSETEGGTYVFDVVANPQPALATPFPHRKTVVLNVNDLGVIVEPSSVAALRGETVQTTAQAKSLAQFSGNVTMSCNVSPPGGPDCAVAPSSFALATGATQNLTVNITNTTVVSNNYTINVVASSSATNPGPGPFTRSNSLTLALKPAEMFVVTSGASSVAPGDPVSIIVRAVNASGGTMTNYNSTIQFTSSDPLIAGLPATYTFNESENGLHIFTATLNTVGPHSITVTDTTPFATTGTSPIIRVDSVDTDNTITLEPVPAPVQDAYFQNENVTFMATVRGTSASPQGSVQFYNGANPIGTPVPLPANTNLSKTVSKTFPLTVGDHPISAVFQPSGGGFTANMSDTLMQRRFPTPRCVNNVCPGSH